MKNVMYTKVYNPNLAKSPRHEKCTLFVTGPPWVYPHPPQGVGGVLNNR